jgi:hypothetical protein
MFQKLIFIYNTCTALKSTIIAEYRKGLEKYSGSVFFATPILVAIRPKAWVCGSSLAGIAGSNPAGGMDVCLL